MEIKIGNTTILSDALLDITLDEAVKKFNKIDPRKIESAYKIANPNWKKGKKKAFEKPKKDKN